MADLWNNFNQTMDSGGFLMWVIFICAWIALLLIIERFLQFNFWLKKSVVDLAKLKDNKLKIEDKKLGKISPVAVIFNQVQKDCDENNTDKISAEVLNNIYNDTTEKLSGTMPTIAILGSLLPMLGLLGTVMGMIEVFEVIALHGTGNPTQMAEGISKALFTTAGGLFFAIPIIFFHHILEKKYHQINSYSSYAITILFKK
ncbi:MAG: hypothetical protein DRQ51_02980 [Gammaproteobacteria bacterium]|nr:MAG: hypothetical protein DRQ51_02980 [Gammaproteobacteria bacterium]